jgi:hypothetical protein
MKPGHSVERVSRTMRLEHIDLFDDPSWDSPEGREEAATDQLLANSGRIGRGMELAFFAIALMAVTVLVLLCFLVPWNYLFSHLLPHVRYFP